MPFMEACPASLSLACSHYLTVCDVTTKCTRLYQLLTYLCLTATVCFTRLGQLYNGVMQHLCQLS